MLYHDIDPRKKKKKKIYVEHPKITLVRDDAVNKK